MAAARRRRQRQEAARAAAAQRRQQKEAAQAAMGAEERERQQAEVDAHATLLQRQREECVPGLRSRVMHTAQGLHSCIPCNCWGLLACRQGMLATRKSAFVKAQLSFALLCEGFFKFF